MSDLLNALYPAQDWCHTHHAGGLWKNKGLECHCYDSNIKAMIAMKASDRCRMMHPTSIMRMKASLAGSCWCSGPALCSFWQLLHSNSIIEDSHFTDTLSLHRLGLYGWFLWAVQSSAREAICLDLCWFLLAFALVLNQPRCLGGWHQDWKLPAAVPNCWVVAWPLQPKDSRFKWFHLQNFTWTVSLRDVGCIVDSLVSKVVFLSIPGLDLR